MNARRTSHCSSSVRRPLDIEEAREAIERVLLGVEEAAERVHRDPAGVAQSERARDADDPEPGEDMAQAVLALACAEVDGDEERDARRSLTSDPLEM